MATMRTVAGASRYEIYRALSPDSPATPFDALWDGIAEQLEAEIEAVSKEMAEGNSGDVDLSVKVDSGVCLDAVLDRLAPSKSIPIEELQANHPAVVGILPPDSTSGHLCVLVGVEFEKLDSKLSSFRKMPKRPRRPFSEQRIRTRSTLGQA